jgi:hypothetical protein
MDDMLRIRELKQQGFFCSQILIILGLELQGKENPDLIRAIQGLAGGLGFTGNTCGSLTGGACFLGLYAGKGTPEQQEDERLNLMIMDLVEWFKQGTGAQYNGIDCDTILEGNLGNIPLRCPVIVQSVYQKCKELLVEYGYDLSGNPTD